MATVRLGKIGAEVLYRMLRSAAIQMELDSAQVLVSHRLYKIAVVSSMS